MPRKHKLTHHKGVHKGTKQSSSLSMDILCHSSAPPSPKQSLQLEIVDNVASPQTDDYLTVETSNYDGEASTIGGSVVLVEASTQTIECVTQDEAVQVETEWNCEVLCRACQSRICEEVEELIDDAEGKCKDSIVCISHF